MRYGILLGALAWPSQGPPEFRTYDLAPFLRRADDEPRARFASHLDFGRARAGRESSAPRFFGPARGPLSLDALLQLLRTGFPEDGPESPLEVEVAGERLVVRASPPRHDALRRSLDALGEGVARRVVLDVALLEGSAAALPSGVLSGSPPPEGGASRAALARTLLETFEGETVSLFSRREASLLLDYDVEAATRATIADPVVGSALLGHAVDLRAHVLAGGRGVHLTILADRAVLLGVEPFEAGAPRLGTIEVPRLAVHALAATAVVPPGSALLVGTTGVPGAEGPGFLLSVRPSVPDTPAGNAPARVLSCQFLADASGRHLHRLSDDLLPIAEPNPVPEGESVTASRLLQWLRAGPGPDRGAPTLLGEGMLAFAGPAKPVEAEAERIRGALESAPAEGVLLDLDLQAAGGDPLRGARLAASRGRSCGALVAVETTRVVDYDVEIAERAAIADPVVERRHDGFAFRARLLALSPGRALVAYELRASALGPGTLLDPKAQDVGALERATDERASLEGARWFRLGAREALGEVPGPGGGAPSLQVALAVRAFAG